MNKLIIDGIVDFNLDHIFDCGQCFRWNKEGDGSYTGVAGGKVVNMALKGTDLIVTNATVEDFEGFWKNYLDMNTDYGEIKKELSSKDEKISEAIKKGEGIRILNQEVWETTASFIISANNNIPRIKGCIESLSENFGEYLGKFKGKKRYAFPKPEDLATLMPDDLNCARLGYRAKYIINAAKVFVEKGNDNFAKLANENILTEDAFSEVSKISGVGPKVANCILLFSMKKRDSFPIDIWMKKVMADMYGFDEEDVDGMEKFAKGIFGEFAGLAQQYLFYYIRNKRDEE